MPFVSTACMYGRRVQSYIRPVCSHVDQSEVDYYFLLHWLMMKTRYDNDDKHLVILLQKDMCTAACAKGLRH